jgi:holliday junction DNA helicase RuvA
MISRIRGQLLRRELDRIEVLTDSGVGYELAVPTTVYETLPKTGEQVDLRVLHLVREDAHLLFGFRTDGERTLFSRLLGATGVGPRIALALLSAMRADVLSAAIQSRDIAALSRVSGVGKKTAERLVLDLSGKLADLQAAAGQPGAAEAVRVLAALGLPQAEAERSVRAALDAHGERTTSELVRLALATNR